MRRRGSRNRPPPARLDASAFYGAVARQSHVEPDSDVVHFLDLFDKARVKKDREGMEHNLVEAVHFAREANAIVAEGLLFAAAVYFVPAFEPLRPSIDWEAVYPETFAVDLTASLCGV